MSTKESWRKLKDDAAESESEEMSPPESKSAPILSPAAERKGELRRIVEPFIKIGKMSVCYVQPDPLPNYIEMLQSLRHEDVDYVKIPVNSKEDKLYLRQAITKLLTRTGIHWDKVKDLINDYNDDSLEAKKKREETRSVLLKLVDISVYYCEKEGVEFLRETYN